LTKQLAYLTTALIYDRKKVFFYFLRIQQKDKIDHLSIVINVDVIWSWNRPRLSVI